MELKIYKAVIFDMDGTILDTSEDLANVVNYAMQQCGRRHDFTKEHACRFFGSGVKVALKRALACEKGYSYDRLLAIGTPDGQPLDADEEALTERLLAYYLPYYLLISMYPNPSSEAYINLTFRTSH